MRFQLNYDFKGEILVAINCYLNNNKFKSNNI